LFREVDAVNIKVIIINLRRSLARMIIESNAPLLARPAKRRGEMKCGNGERGMIYF